MKVENKLSSYCLMTLVGIAIFLIGAILLKHNAGRYISGLCMGIGSGLFVIFGRMVMTSAIEKKYDIWKFVGIEVNDERNTAIRDKAGAKTSRLMNYLLFILAVTFAFMNVSLYIVFLMIALMIIQGVLFIIFSNQYSKKL